jgi:hypothetical protein
MIGSDLRNDRKNIHLRSRNSDIPQYAIGLVNVGVEARIHVAFNYFGKFSLAAHLRMKNGMAW